MEINVTGVGKGSFKPDEVILNVNITATGSSYEEALKKGENSLENLINAVLLPNGFSKDDLKTNTFTIMENQKYNQESKNYEKDGYIFMQNGSFDFKYSVDMLDKVVGSISTLDNDSISFDFSFGLSNIDEVRKDLICKAYIDAKNKAQIVASCASLELNSCRIATLNDNSFDFNNARVLTASNNSFANNISPSDIDLFVNMQCVWVTK